MTRAAARRLSRLHKPADMSLEDWQLELRRQFGREQDVRAEELGDEPVFSEFEVTNPQSPDAPTASRIRGARPGDNFCTCPDFATNTLGTCKHIEFTLAQLERKRGGARRLARGSSRRTARSSCTTARSARCVSGPGPIARVELRLAARVLRRRRQCLRAEAFAPLRAFLAARGRVRPRPALLRRRARVRRRGPRRRRAASGSAREAFPRGIRDAAFKDAAQGRRSTTTSARARCSPPAPAAA